MCAGARAHHAVVVVADMTTVSTAIFLVLVDAVGALLG